MWLIQYVWIISLILLPTQSKISIESTVLVLGQLDTSDHQLRTSCPTPSSVFIILVNVFLWCPVRTHSCLHTHTQRLSFIILISDCFLSAVNRGISCISGYKSARIIWKKKRKCISKPRAEFGQKLNHISCTGAVWDVASENKRVCNNETTHRPDFKRAIYVERPKWCGV